MSWPQWFMVGYFALAVVVAVAANGMQRKGTHNGAVTILVVVVLAAVLHFGGFWE